MGIIGLLYAVSFIFNHERELSFKEAMFLYCGGMIRGAIAFGLVLRLDQSLPNRQVIITTSLWLVILTTLLFGSMMPILGKVLLGPSKEELALGHDHEDGHHNNDEKELKDLSGSHEVDDEPSHHELLIHPNFDEAEVSVVSPNKKKSNPWVKYFKEIDDTLIRPILIYKYSKERKEKVYEFHDMMMKKGQQIEQVYTKKRDSVTEEEKDGDDIVDVMRHSDKR